MATFLSPRTPKRKADTAFPSPRAPSTPKRRDTSVDEKRELIKKYDALPTQTASNYKRKDIKIHMKTNKIGPKT